MLCYLFLQMNSSFILEWCFTSYYIDCFLYEFNTKSKGNRPSHTQQISTHTYMPHADYNPQDSRWLWCIKHAFVCVSGCVDM